MKTNKEYMIREIAGESVLIPVGMASQRLNGMIRLTESAAFIWEQVDQAENLTQIIEQVKNEFEVDDETARRDVEGFLRELYIRDMVQDIPELDDDITRERKRLEGQASIIEQE